MPTVIDALLVTLNLKPENFTKGMGEASKAQDKLAAGTKTLDAHEKKLTETQKVAVKNLRESAVVAERAKKELSAAAGVGQGILGRSGKRRAVVWRRVRLGRLCRDDKKRGGFQLRHCAT